MNWQPIKDIDTSGIYELLVSDGNDVWLAKIDSGELYIISDAIIDEEKIHNKLTHYCLICDIDLPKKIINNASMEINEQTKILKDMSNNIEKIRWLLINRLPTWRE